jgi:CAAX prenyl protease-like protein
VSIAFALLLPRQLQEQVMARHEPGGALQQALATLAAVAVAPLVEELAFRGYLLRRFASPHFETIPPRAAGALGVLVSSVLFGALHPAWGAGVAFGLLFAWAYLWRGRLTDAILAHALTNLALVLVLS